MHLRLASLPILPRWLTFLAAAAGAVVLHGADAARLGFDIPADTAENTLKVFARQSKRGVIYVTAVVEGVRTNAVQGALTAGDALDQMLADTVLVATEDEKTEAFAIRRRDASERPREPAVSHAADAPPKADSVVTLSPFMVNSVQDTGWEASTTLLSNRTNTLLRDTPVAIDALTMDFMQDVGVYNEFEAAKWVSNVQVADETGRTDQGREYFRGIQNQWNANRNFFRWYVPNDNYNVERVDFGRGSNSLLFGDNEPGGQATIYTKRAKLGNTFTTALVQGGSFDSYRWQFDRNQVVNDQLAFRINATNSRDGRNFDFNNFSFKGYDATVTWRPLKNTEVRVEAETGGWERVWGDNNNSMLSKPAAGLGLSNRLTILQNGTFIDNTIASGTINGVAFSKARDTTAASGGALTIDDRDTRQIGNFSFRGFPEHYNWAGPDNWNNRNYSTFTVFLEQHFTPKLDLELAFNQQKQWWDISGLGNSPYTASVDFNGRRYVDVSWSSTRQQNRALTPRATLAYNFDHWSWMQQTFVATAEGRTDQFMNVARQWRDPNASGATAATNISGAGFRPWFRYYLDDPSAYAPSLDQMVKNLPAGTRAFATSMAGQQHETKAYAFSMSGQYFGGRLQSLFGSRYDMNDTATVASTVNNAANKIQGEFIWPGSKSENPSAWRYDPTFHLRRWTYNAGLVFAVTKTINLYAMDSTSFRFAGAANFVNEPLGAIDGRTKEYGFKTSFLNDQLQWNVSYYDLARRNVRVTFDRGGLTDAQLEAAINAGLTTGAPGYLPVVAGSSADVGDNFSRGWETSFLFSPLEGLRVRLGGAEGDVIQQNAFQTVNVLLAAAVARKPTDPTVLGYITTLQRSLASSGANGQQVTGAGAVRGSLNYAFDYRFRRSSMLKNVSLGVNGGYNGDFTLGYVGAYPSDQPIMGGRMFTLNGTAAYQCKVFGQAVKFRLIAYNLIAPAYREVGLVALDSAAYSKQLYYGPPLSFRLTASTTF